MEFHQAMGILVERHAPAAADQDFEAGFLEALSLDGVDWKLTGLALAAGKLPVAGIDSAGWAPSHEKTAVASDQADADRDGLGAGKRTVVVARKHFFGLSSSCPWRL
jgi:hypothetical protein